MRRSKFFTVFVGALCALGLGAAVALAVSEDSWSSGANSSWSASLTSGHTAVFSSTVASVTCTASSVGGSSIGASPDVGQLASNAPTFSSCTDTILGGTGTASVATSGSWTTGFYSDTSPLPAACPSTNETESTDGTDCIVEHIPNNGVVITLHTGCTVKISSNSGGSDAGGKVTDDDTGTNAATADFSSVSLPFSGTCGSGTGTWSANYTLSAPNSGKIWDNS